MKFPSFRSCRRVRAYLGEQLIGWQKIGGIKSISFFLFLSISTKFAFYGGEKETKAQRGRHPIDHLTILVLQNMSNDVSELHKIPEPPDLEALKLRKVRPSREKGEKICNHLVVP